MMSLKLSDDARKKIIDMLNEDRAQELTAIIQYMGHHYEGEGIESPAILELFKKTAMDEMRHAESLAERIVYLGGVPVYKPGPVQRGGDLRTMLKADLGLEDDAIERYRGHIKVCAELGDTTTRLMLEKILSEEEGHADAFETALGRG
ncbi:MAG: ferritin-like domain-containing protein [Deltaproteobacteria bacterium]|nr:ferritin-like domain-containing protein [Deltaproteobacteria bacterium]